MGRVCRLGFRLALALGGAIASSGCGSGAKTPEQAYERLAQAVGARDGARLYDALDLQTRWSWMSVQKAHRESYDIILSNFPEGAERERHLRRCTAGALAQDARQLFAGQMQAPAWEALAASLPASGAPAGAAAVQGDEVQLTGAAGRPLPFRRGPEGRGGWGYAGLAREAEDQKLRALADLDLVRNSAADYERAAARQMR